MILKIEKLIHDTIRFKDGLMEMPFVLSVARFNGYIWSIKIHEDSTQLEIDKVNEYVEGFDGEYTYFFDKTLDTEVFKEAILYKSTLDSKYVKHAINEGLEVVMSESLTDDEFNELYSIVEQINDGYDLSIRKKYKNNIIKLKKDFGTSFMDEFSAMNAANNKTIEQITGLISKYPLMPIMCITGSIETLYSVIQTMEPDENVTIEEINEFKKRIELFLLSLEQL